VSKARAKPRRSLTRRLLRWAALGFLVLLIAPVVFVIAYRFVPPPATPLMLLRALDGAWPPNYRWRSLERISPQLWRAVIAAEDARFCDHAGFDWIELERAWETWRSGGKLRGASTISNQTAKNLLLWPGRSLLRKGGEAWVTLLLEALWPKRRILEAYLNIAEWGDGIYGAEAAARAYFGVPAARISVSQAAVLAALLPSPRERGAAWRSSAVRERAALIRERAEGVDVATGKVCPR
jgi:monofunctional biosynthetic peptidoglycan transglycosylase